MMKISWMAVKFTRQIGPATPRTSNISSFGPSPLRSSQTDIGQTESRNLHMGSTTNTSVVRIDFDSSPSLKTRTKAEPSALWATPTWVTAASLRPNTQYLAEACIAGNLEAMAVRDSWQFNHDGAIRVVVLTRAQLDAADAGNMGFCVAPGGNTGSTGGRPSQRAAGPSLNDSMVAYQLDSENGQDDLLKAINRFALKGSQQYRQGSIREVGGDADLAQEFTVHAFEQIRLGKYTGKGKFSNWLGSVFSNFSSSELNKLTREKKKYVGLISKVKDGQTELSAKKGYQADDGISWKDYQIRELAAKGASHMEGLLDDLSPADRAYASFLQAGKKKGEAAQAMGESVVTSRKRKERIREALDKVTLGGKAA